MARQKGKKKGKRETQSPGQARKAGEEFLAKNASRPDITACPSGLQYKVIQASDSGLSPMPEDTVVVNQRITLVNGKVLRDTFDAKETDKFTVSEVIPGLQEGLSLMKEGAHYKFFIPYDLAWGKRGIGNSIGPYAMLIADIWLLEVQMK